MRPALSPCMIGTCKIENRFVMTAANLGYCRDGYVTEDVIAFYRERARGRTGLIIAGAAGVDPERINVTGMMQICDDSCIEPMRALTREVHREGSRIFLQLMHAGAYAKQSEHRGKAAVAPSACFCKFTREEADELTGDEINRIVSCFRDSAVRARKAGFDGIELAGSAGYLISEFLSGAVNERKDGYGGTIPARVRFLMEIIRAVREGTGQDYPIMVRLSGSDFVPGGNSLEDVLEIGRLLERYIDAVDVTGGWHESRVPQITYNVPRGMYLYLARAMKETLSIPVIGCNRLDLSTAVRAIENGDCHMAGILRGLTADPYLVKKYIEGRSATIRPCLACNEQCLDRIFSGEKVGCAVNYMAGREGRTFRCRDENKDILVIGAGVSGLAYAALAAQKNRVTVWERDITCGGAARAVGRIPYRQDVSAYLCYLYARCLDLGVTFRWRKEAGAEEIRKLTGNGTFHRVILAVGSTMAVSGYETEPGTILYTPEECILGERLPGRRIVVIGSGYKAVQTAQYCVMAGKTGEEEQHFLKQYAPESLTCANSVMRWAEPSVTLLSPEKRIGRGFGKSTRFIMLEDIRQKGVTVISGAEIKRIGRNQVVYLEDGREKNIQADMTIISEGWQKNRELVFRPEESGDRITVIGDARRPGRISDAVKDAFEAAMSCHELQ